MELGCVGDEEDVAVNVDRRAYRPEEQGEDVARFMGKDKDWCAEIMHLKHTWIPKLLDIYIFHAQTDSAGKAKKRSYSV